jgi:diaminohydroxyphosphoribosylaminopyrimidine deaminase / 5-amino-6-(5-phosphoribosylamino)uracil reductase
MKRLDEIWMRRAIELAEGGARTAAPNPFVGAVVVKDNKAIGEGFHLRPGEPHAEIVALKSAGKEAQGATVYVNLEPCCHKGRTGPCTKALIKAGVKRVVAGMQDPFPRVSGKGFAALKKAGIDVECGVLDKDCRRLNEAFICRITNNRPFVTLKMAITLDGKIATRTGDSKWITGESARNWVHDLRARIGAILVGVGTVETDDPLLTARPENGTNLQQPLRVVLDSRGSMTGKEQLCQTLNLGPVLQVVADANGGPIKGVERLVLPNKESKVDLSELLRVLSEREINHLLVEGGSRVAGSFHAQRLVDHYVFCIAPKLVGDASALPCLAGQMINKMDEAMQLCELEVSSCGNDIIISGVPGER